MDSKQLETLRRIINENLRIQRGSASSVPFIDPAHLLTDACSCQNHAIFGRRGCGKTLLLHHSVTKLNPNIKTIYLNCEDFKNHSFPNVLIEILDTLFAELENNLTGWFGKKARSRELIVNIRKKLQDLQIREDIREEDVKLAEAHEDKNSDTISGAISEDIIGLKAEERTSQTWKYEIEKRYKHNRDKVRELNLWLPSLKKQIREFFDISTSVMSIFLQVDDFYHLPRADQPFVIDYIHRICKDIPLYFKVATLRHASTLYIDHQGQPIGAQERHDYQPINVDFSLADFTRTVQLNKNIFQEFGRLSGISKEGINALFKGVGFQRLILSGGGVPRDCLSLFLEVLESVQPPTGDGRIGKDDIRILSRSNFERRIEELKQDSEGQEQGKLIKAIYVIRQFCISMKSNIILVPEVQLQRNDNFRILIYRLLDYRIIHSAGTALTHKSQSGTYHAFAVDIGCYAHMRVLHGKMIEIDLSDPMGKDKMRSAPILDETRFDALWKESPDNGEAALLTQEES